MAVSLTAALATAFVVLPLMALLFRVRWSGVLSTLSNPSSVSALRLSLVTSVSAMVASVALGTPLAWVLARRDLRGASFLRGLVLLPMVVPPVVGGVALLSAFGLGSPIGRSLNALLGVQLTFSTTGAVMAGTFVALPFYVLAVEAALRSIDLEYELTASTLGASRWMTFTRVTLPLAAPSMVAGAVLAWARALGEFGATITFAGNIEGRTRTLPLAVYLAMERDPNAAMALSLVLIAVSIAVLVVLRDRWFSDDEPER